MVPRPRVGSPFFHLQSEAGSIRQPLCYLHHFSTLSHQSRIAKRAAGGSASAIPTGLLTQTIRALCVRRSRLFFLQKKARQNHTENAFLCIKCVKCCHHIHRFGRKNVGSEILQDNMLSIKSYLIKKMHTVFDYLPILESNQFKNVDEQLLLLTDSPP